MQKEDIKIAIDARELKKDLTTGIKRFLKNFLDNIREKNIYLCIDKNTYIDDYKDKFNILKINTGFTFYYDFFCLNNLIKKNDIDIFFSPYYKAPLFNKARRIITIHDLHFLNPSLRKGLNRIKPFISYLKVLIKNSYKIITVSEFSKSQIIKNFSIDKDKIKVIYNGISNIFRKVPEDYKVKLKEKYSIDFPYILYVGNILPHKNLAGLILAFNILQEKYKDYKLIIIAKRDKNFFTLSNLIKKLNLEKKIIFFDFVFDNDLVLFYNFSNIFVFPSFYEGFGLPPLEAISCGATVACSYIEPLKEILNNSVIYFDPYSFKDIAEKIDLVLSDDKLMIDLRKRAQEVIKRYKVDIFANSLLKEIYGI